MYELIQTPFGQTIIHRISDGAFIPRDLNNPAYVEYIVWRNEGNIPVVKPTNN